MNLANKLTILRIFLIPIFMVFLLNKIPCGEPIAAGIFIIAAITDILTAYCEKKK